MQLASYISPKKIPNISTAPPAEQFELTFWLFFPSVVNSQLKSYYFTLHELLPCIAGLLAKGWRYVKCTNRICLQLDGVAPLVTYLWWLQPRTKPTHLPISHLTSPFYQTKCSRGCSTNVFVIKFIQRVSQSVILFLLNFKTSLHPNK